MLDFLARMVPSHPWKILCAWLALALVLTIVAPNWKDQSQDDDIRFLPEHCASVRAYHLLEKAFPKDVYASRAIIVIERPNAPLTADDFALTDRLADRLRALHREQPSLTITGVDSYRDGPVGRRLLSEDRHCTLIRLSLSTPYLALQTRDAVDCAEAELRAIVAESGPDAPTLFVTGPAGIGRDLVTASARSLDRTTLATIILVVLVLLLVYRSPLLALVPLVTIGVAVWVSMKILALATLIPGVHIVNVSQVFAIVILFGAGTDYCLFLICRYREELEFGHETTPAINRSLRAVAGALIASAATVICGLGMMGFAEFGKIRSAGPVIAIGLAVGLAASLTLTPALLRLARRHVFWPQRIKLLGHFDRQGIWQRISGWVVRKPATVFFVAGIPLFLLAMVGKQVAASFKPIGDLSSNADSVRGLEAVGSHFTAGETGPMTVVLASPVDWNSKTGREVIARLSGGFGRLPNVAEVRSLTQPLGKTAEPPPAPVVPQVKKKRKHQEEPPLFDWKPPVRKWHARLGDYLHHFADYAAQHHFLSEIQQPEGRVYVTRLDVIFRSDPFEAESLETLKLFDTWLIDFLPGQVSSFGPVRAEVYGVTVHTRDMGAVIARDRTKVNLLVAGGVFLILLALVRRAWLAGYLLGTVLLSYYATLGLTALFTMWLTGRPFGVVEWRVPFFLFTILVAVGEDYNILLVTRVMQERARFGVVEGTRRALAATGGTITACGLIMAGTFGTLMLADLSTLKQIGFALCVGVLMDSFVVRPLLVPAFLLLAWKETDPIAARRRQVIPTAKAA